MFGVTILGNNSAIPAYERHPTAQVVTLDQHQFLIDCGEGTQMQLARYKVRRSRINHIFISHLHGDHYFGLIGLITSMGLMNRENDLHLYAPLPLKNILDLQFQAADTRLPFTLHFHPLDSEEVIAEDAKYSVECFKVTHRIECWGFLFRERKKPRKIDKEKIAACYISTNLFEKLKSGEDVTDEAGKHIANESVTLPAAPSRSYAFCADTIFDEDIACKVKDVNVLYHETTYLKNLEDRAASRFHSTTVQAASIAVKANAKRLLIGHFSSKYETLDEFLLEAKEVFADTELALEGCTYRIA